MEFLQANAGWIVFGLLFVLMMRMHGSGAGCCGGHQHGAQQPEQRPDQERESLPQPRGAGSEKERDNEKEKEVVAADNHRHSGGCH